MRLIEILVADARDAWRFFQHIWRGLKSAETKWRQENSCDDCHEVAGTNPDCDGECAPIRKEWEARW